MACLKSNLSSFSKTESFFTANKDASCFTNLHLINFSILHGMQLNFPNVCVLKQQTLSPFLQWEMNRIQKQLRGWRCSIANFIAQKAPIIRDEPKHGSSDNGNLG